MSSSPDSAESANAERERFLQQGRRYQRSGDRQAAHAIADRLLRDFEATAETLLFAGEVQFSKGNFVDAEQFAARCIAEFSDELGGPVLRCRALMGMGRQGEARDLALAVCERDFRDESHVDVLVTVLSGCLVPEAAYPLCKRSVERHPGSARSHRRLARNCRLIGNLDEALEAADVAVQADPHDYEMIALRSSLQAASDSRNHIDGLEALLAAGCRSRLGAAQVCYALAKELEDVERHERSFSVLNVGAQFKRQTLNFDPNDDIRAFRDLEQQFTSRALPDATPGHLSREPIFILGLPRTGSTLLERILSSHSDVFAAGELLHFEAAMLIGARKRGPVPTRSHLFEVCRTLDMQELGGAYLKRTRPYTGHTKHFIDKRPLNFTLLGFIRAALPNATIIHVRRTPMDACYAIYKFLFEETYPWSYDLDEIAAYYLAYRRLMDHWRSIMPDAMMEIAYEDVVADLEGVARRLLERVGLDWEPSVVDFHRNRAAAHTGSAVQVRQEIYTSSIGRWRHYEDQLQPLADRLESAGIDPYNP